MPTYSPEDVVLSFKGVQIDGLATGTMITVTRSTDTWSSEVGGYGDVTRTKSMDRRGRVTFHTMKEAPINDILSSFLEADEESNTGKGPFQLSSLNSKTLHSAEESWFVKPPDDEYDSSTSSTLEWTLECAKLKMHFAGADS